VPERFELIAVQRGVSGQLRLSYGTGANDPELFALTVNPQYVARATGKAPPITFNEIEKYAYDHAGELRSMGSKEKGSGRLSLILE
jgi:hypothetical protein